MTMTFEYASYERLSLPELLKIRNRLKDYYPSIIDEGIKPEKYASAGISRKILPSIGELERGGKINNITVEGVLSLNTDPFPTFMNLLKLSQDGLSDCCSVWVNVGFEEKESQQIKTKPDLFSIVLRQDTFWFHCWAIHSKAGKDYSYCRDYFSRLIETLDLPLKLEQENEYFRLIHKFSGGLDINVALLGGLSPKVFSCELSDMSPETAVGKLEKALDCFSSSKRFEYSWSTVPLFKEGDDWRVVEVLRSHQMYAMLLKENFPAETYNLKLSYSTNTVNAVDSLKGLCKDEGMSYMFFYSFQHPADKDEYVRLFVETTAEGHRIIAEASMPFDEEEVGKTLGIKLVPQFE